MAFELMKLPFAKKDLSPYLSEETIDYHYGKHHAGYVKKLNELIHGTYLEDLFLQDIIIDPNTLSVDEGKAIHDNASQVWNHNFYWKCLTAEKNSRLDKDLRQAIEKQWRDFSSFKEVFIETAEKIFGTGWCWLVQDSEGNLEIMPAEDEENPLGTGKTALLACDVWEHAYYIDYRNDRKKYLQNFFNIVNWSFVAQNLKVPELLEV